MRLRLVLGRAGAGKTAYCLAAVAGELGRRQDGPPLILLVPEQATFQMEQALLAEVARRAGRRGFARARVLSFQRLAWLVLQETGGAAAPAVGDLGKRLILRALLARAGGQLRLFDRVADRPGFIERLARTLAELAAYGHDAATLRAQRQRLAAEGREDSLLAAKLHDLERVMEAYDAYLAERGLVDPAHALDRLAERLPASRWLRGALIWIDGFTGFTPQELQVIEVLLRLAGRVEVTLCLDPAELAAAGQDGGRPGASRHRDETALFHPTWATRDQLLERAARAGAAVEPPVVLPAGGAAGSPPAPPRFLNPVLAHVERELFRFPGRRYPGPASGLTLVAAPDRRAEVAAAAREILRLAREHGYRFRDMAVIVRDLEAYHDLLVAAFAEHGIPLFVDRRRPVGHHPLVELVRAAVEVVAADWPYEAVFRYLKTDLVPVERGAVDRLENYVLAFGLRGRPWYDGRPWRWWRRYTLEEDEEPGRGQEEELALLNEARDRAVAHLRRFHRRVAAARQEPRPAAELTEALYELLEDLEVPARIRRWSEEAEAAGDLDRAQEHLQVWNGIVELLEQAVESLPGLDLTLGDYLRVLEAGLEGMRVGLIPPGLDQVVAGTVERSRHPNVRAAFVLGATDDAFPRRVEEDAIFSDAEREELAAGGMELGPTGRVRTFHEQYLTYVALTRARERLWISYPVGDEEGRAITPAWITRRLRVLIPDLAVTSAEASGPEAAATPQQAVDLLVRTLRRAGEAGGLPEAGAHGAAAAGPGRTAGGHDGAGGGGATPGRATGPVPGVDAPAVGRSPGPAPGRPREAGAGEEPPGAGWRVLYQWAVTEPEVRPRALAALRALAHANRVEPLGRDLARLLYARRRDGGWVLAASVTRLESFAGCPFQHFAAHGLRLREREVHRLDAPRLGQVYHAALSLLARRLRERGWDWAELDEGRLQALLEEILGELKPRLAEELAAGSGYQQHLLAVAGRTLKRAAERLVEHARRGAFRPLDVEVEFGPDPQARLRVPPLPLPGGERLALRGRIDRIDGAPGAGGRWWVRVVDYKSSQRDLRLDELYHGLALQLAVYLLVATRAGASLLPSGPAGGAVEPAALLFIPVHDPYLDTPAPMDPEAAAQQRAKQQLRASGWVVADPEVLAAHDRDGRPETLIPVVLNQDGTPRRRVSRVLSRGQLEALFAHVERRLVEMSDAVLAGRAEVAPYRMKDRSPCAHCAFRAVCQFDPRVPGNGYRWLPSLSPDEVWARVDGREAAPNPGAAEPGARGSTGNGAGR